MNELDLGINDPLAATSEDVAHLTRPEREARLDALIQQSRDFVSDAIERLVHNEGRMVAATAVMLSGGNDSTALAHLFRHDVDLAVHANTTIGIEETRDFVRNTCEEWGLSLIERTPPREQDHYRALVLTRQRGKKGQALGGFPGPAMHWKMFQRLKERAVEQVQRELVTNPRRERLVCIFGRRRDESERRSNIRPIDRRGSRLNISPLVNWTKADLNTYRLRGGVPVNQTADLIHMSGECLCGSFASPGERAEVSYWFPAPFEEIAAMEAALVGRDDIPEHRKTWGWGADPVLKAAETAYLKRFDMEDDEPQSGLMCSSCADRFQLTLDLGGVA